MKKSLNIFFITVIILLIISCESNQGPRENDINDNNNVGEESVITLGERVGIYKGTYTNDSGDPVDLILNIEHDKALFKGTIGTTSHTLQTNISSSDTNDNIMFEERSVTKKYIGHKIIFDSLTEANYTSTNNKDSIVNKAILIKEIQN